MAIERLNPESVFDPLKVGPFSLGVVTDPGRLMFVSGMAAVDRDMQVVGRGDIKAQTQKTLENLRATVEAGGGSVNDIVSITVYLTDVNDYQAMNEVRQEFFAGALPASTAVGIDSLVLPELLVEINAIAVLS
jgi:reactive intermediate/imine deaminase